MTTSRALLHAAILAAGTGIPGLAQPAAVPSEFQELYRTLEQKIDVFDKTVSSQWNGERAKVVWSAELLSVSGSRGPALLDPKTHESLMRELTSLQALGVQGITVAINFPILYQPFFAFNGDPGDYPRFLDFYKQLAAEVHRRGLKLVVESAMLVPGFGGNTFKLAEYYRSLDGKQLVLGRAQNIVTVAREIGPDFLNLGSEPDTQATLSGKMFFQEPDGYATVVAAFVKQLRAAGVSGIPIGAGIGTWQRNGEAFVQALLKTGIDYLDLHVYPVSGNGLANAITYADMAAKAGKPVGMSEAWLAKEDFRKERQPMIVMFSRDRYRFWAPLDQKFLGALVKYAHWKRLLYFSPFWTTYFWSYVDYEASHDVAPAEGFKNASKSAQHAIENHQISDTGGFYRDAILGKR